MDATEQATEQITRIMLMGTEYTLRLSGSGAKNLSAMLISAAKGNERTKGKIRLESLLKSGRPLSVFEIKRDDMTKFAGEAKRYGILYTVIAKPKEAGDISVDVLVKSDDAVRVNRIFEKLEMGTIDTKAIEATVADIKAGRTEEAPPSSSKGAQTKDEASRLIDDLLAKPAEKEREAENPTAAKTEKSAPSEHSSEKDKLSAEAMDKDTAPSTTERTDRDNAFGRDELSPEDRPSVRKKLKDISYELKEKAASPPALPTETRHQQPALKRGKPTPEKGR